MVFLKFCDKHLFVEHNDLRRSLDAIYYMSKSLYCVYNGKILRDSSCPDIPRDAVLHLRCRLDGGKGGFGSMLRLIGSQIEKTTNNDMCRDLNGRRLRDVKNEKRLEKWLTEKDSKDCERRERKKRKLEDSIRGPKHMFENKDYFDRREIIPGDVQDAVTAGMSTDPVPGLNKRRKLTFGLNNADLSDSSCSSGTDDVVHEHVDIDAVKSLRPGDHPEDQSTLGLSRKSLVVRDDEGDNCHNPALEQLNNDEIPVSIVATRLAGQPCCSTNALLFASNASLVPRTVQPVRHGQDHLCSAVVHDHSASNQPSVGSTSNAGIEEIGTEKLPIHTKVVHAPVDDELFESVEGGEDGTRNGGCVTTTEVEPVLTTEVEPVTTTEVVPVTTTGVKPAITTGVEPVVKTLADLNDVSSVVDIEALGLEVLKKTLQGLGMKCGGSLSERAARLWAVRGVATIPLKLLAKKK